MFKFGLNLLTCKRRILNILIMKKVIFFLLLLLPDFP